MVRAPYFDKTGLKKGAWSPEEDDKLRAYIHKYGHWNWRELPKFAGLSRCGKSCRLRWINYLQPGLKHGNYSKEEEELIIKLHQKFGNKWSKIAENIPGRTDNEIKNYWHTNLKRQRPKETQNSFGSKYQFTTKNSKFEIEKIANPKIDNFTAKTPHSIELITHPILESYPLSPEPSSSSEMSSFNSVDSSLVTPSSATSSNVEDRASSSFEITSGDFWTQPFVADQYNYNKFSMLEGDDFISPFFTCYDDSIHMFQQVMQEISMS